MITVNCTELYYFIFCLSHAFVHMFLLVTTLVDMFPATTTPQRDSLFHLLETKTQSDLDTHLEFMDSGDMNYTTYHSDPLTLDGCLCQTKFVFLPGGTESLDVE